MNFGAYRAGRILGLVGNHFERHHHIAFDLNHPAAGVLGDFFAPLSLMPEVAAVAHDQGRVAAGRERDIRGIAFLNDHFNAALGKRSLGLLKPLQHERVMAQIGFRIIVHQPEHNDNPLTQFIGLLNRIFQGMVVFGPLGLLHPVEHIVTLSHIQIIKRPNS